MSGSATALQVRITAKDDASKALALIGANAKAIGGQFSKLGDQFRWVGDSGFGRITQQVRETTRSFERLVPAMGAVTGAASVAGVVAATGRWAQFGAAIGRTAYRTETTARNLTGMQAAAEAMGSSAEDLTSGLKILGDAAADALGGRNNDALMIFNQFGIGIQRANGSAKSGAEMFDSIADAMARLTDPKMQARFAAYLGLPESLIPVLRKGSAAFREQQKIAESYGATIGQDGVKASERFMDAQRRMGWAFTGLGDSIFQTVSPALAGLMRQFADFISLNRLTWAKAIKEGFTWITDAVKEGYARFKAWVDDGGWAATKENLRQIGTGITTVVDGLGGWKTATETLFALWLGAKAIGVITSVVRLGTALAGIGIAIAPIAAFVAQIAALPAAVAALHKLGQQRDKTGARQEEQRKNFAQRGRASGFYGSPAEDPDELLPGERPDKEPVGRVWSAGDAVGEAIIRLQRQFEAVFITRVPADQRLGGYPSGAALRGANDLPGADTSGAGSTPGQLEPEIEKKIRDAAAKHGVDPDFAVRIARIEGGRAGGRDLISPAGAIGTMQLMPGTARDLGVNPNNVDQNIDGGVRHLKQLLGKFDGNQRAVAAAYNAGPAGRGVADFARSGDASGMPLETQRYIQSLDRLMPQGGSGSGGYVHGRDADRPIGKPQQTSQKVPVEVTVRLAGNFPAGTTATARTPDGTRVARAMEGGMG